MIKCADGKIRDGIACKDNPKLLEAMKLKLKESVPTMHGGAGDKNHKHEWDFSCDKTLDDYITNISGKYDATGLRFLKFKCKSGDGPSIGLWGEGGASFNVDTPIPFNSITGNSDSYLRNLKNFAGVSSGLEWTDECPDGEIIRGFKSQHGKDFIDQIGFKCA